MIKNKKNTIEICNDFSKVIESLETKLYQWDFSKEKQFKIVQKELRKHASILAEMPENWADMCTAQYVTGKTFGNYKKLKKFFNQNQELLSKKEKQVLLLFQENPWLYSVFTITKLLDDNFLEIFDISSRKSHLVYSENLVRLSREGKKLFLCLLFYNRKCFQTAGIIHYFQGFDQSDVHTFAGKVSYFYKEESDLSQAIDHKPIPFHLLNRFADIPATVHNNKIIKYCFHSIKAPNFNPGNFSQISEVRKEKNIQKCILKGSKDPFRIKNMYYNSGDHTLHIHTSGIKNYNSIRNMLKDKYMLPLTPEWHCSPFMLAAIEEILGLRPASLSFEKNFVEKRNPEIDRELNKMNAMMHEITDHSNKGIEYSLKELAEKHGVPMETALQLKETLDEVSERMSINLDGGIKGHSVPSPEIRLKFSEPFSNNSLFSFNNNEKAQLLHKINWPSDIGLDELVKDAVYDIAGLPSMVENHYFKVWKDFGYFILMYTIYLLKHNGHKFQKADDYSTEILRIFWQVLSPEQNPDRLDLFYYEYSNFCYIVLFRLGLIEIREKIDVEAAASGDFMLKVSDFFNEWIQFNQD